MGTTKPVRAGEYLIYAGEPDKLVLSRIKGKIGAKVDASKVKIDDIRDRMEGCDCLCHCDCSGICDCACGAKGYCDCNPNICDCDCCTPNQHVELQNVAKQLARINAGAIAHGNVKTIAGKITKPRK